MCVPSVIYLKNFYLFSRQIKFIRIFDNFDKFDLILFLLFPDLLGMKILHKFYNFDLINLRHLPYSMIFPSWKFNTSFHNFNKIHPKHFFICLMNFFKWNISMTIDDFDEFLVRHLNEIYLRHFSYYAWFSDIQDSRDPKILLHDLFWSHDLYFKRACFSSIRLFTFYVS